MMEAASLGQLAPDLGPLKASLHSGIPGAGDARDYVEAQWLMLTTLLLQPFSLGEAAGSAGV